MICPRCNTPNDPVSQFCMSCGQPLDAQGSSQVPTAYSPSNLLGVLTLQLFLALFGLWLVKTILNGLSFIKDLRIPDFNLSPTSMISILIIVVAIVLLFNYARLLRTLWAQSYPRYINLGAALSAFIYVLAMALVYGAARPIFSAFVIEPEPLMVFQVILAVIAIFVLAWAFLLIYQSLPSWIANWRSSLFIPVPVPPGTKPDTGTDK